MSDQERSSKRPTLARLLESQYVKSRAEGLSRARRGQALVEYALIVAFVVIGLIVVINLVGPAIGNVFSNQVVNVVSNQGTPQTPYYTQNATQFVAYVTAVASYTPPTRQLATNIGGGSGGGGGGGGGAACLAPPPPIVPTCTPVPSPTNSQTPTITQTPTNTPVLPTPTDAQFSLPFKSEASGGAIQSNLAAWHYNGAAWPGNNAASGVFTSNLTWTANYYNALNQYSGGAAATLTLPDVNFQGGLPGGVVAPNYSIDYKIATPLTGLAFNPVGQTAPLAVPYEIKAYVVGTVNVLVNGSSIFSGTKSTPAFISAQVSLSGSSASIEVQYTHNVAATGMVQLVINRLADSGNCQWNNTANGRPQNVWGEPGTGNYALNAQCSLRIRGYFDLSQLSGTRELTFWENYAIASGDTLQVGVRQYDSIGAPWQWKTFHGPTIARNLNWTYETINFATDFATSFTTQKVEVAFQLNSDNTSVDSGWFIDSIHIDSTASTIYSVQGDPSLLGSKVVHDDLDGFPAPPNTWVTECQWQQTTTDFYSFNHSWQMPMDPTANTSGGTCSLILNGYIDLTTPDITVANPPQLTFASKFSISGANPGAVGKVRYAPYTVGAPIPPDGSASWTDLIPNGQVTAPVGQSGGGTPQWNVFNINLDNSGPAVDHLVGQKFFLEFLLSKPSAPAVNENGWLLDNIQLRFRPTGTLPIPFYEPFNDLSNWIPSGMTVSPTVGRTTVPAAAVVASGNYLPSTNSYLELTDNILTGATYPNLQMSFYNYWDSPTADLTLEATTDPAWAPANVVTIWSHLQGSPDNTQLAWEREYVDLRKVITDRGWAQPMHLRFHFNSNNNSSTGKGWFIDDLQIVDATPTSIVLNNPPYFFADDMNNGPVTFNTNWYHGGTWQLATGQHNNTQGWVDNNTTSYISPGRSIIELQQVIDLTGTTYPTVSLWVTNELKSTAGGGGANADDLFFDVWRNGIYSGTAPQFIPVWQSQPIMNGTGYETNVNKGWHQILVDLTPYVGQVVHLRLRLNTLNNTTGYKGLGFDDFTVYDRANSALLPVPFLDNFDDALLSNWLPEGQWTTTPDVTSPSPLPVHSGWSYLPASLTPVSFAYTTNTLPTPTNLTTSDWVADYWHLTAGDAAWGGGTPGTNLTSASALPNDNQVKLPLNTGTADVAYNWTGDLTKPFTNGVPQWPVSGVNNYEYYFIRWRRTFSPQTATKYYLRLKVQGGGARIKVNGTLVPPNTPALPPPYVSDTSDSFQTVGTAQRDYYYEFDMAAATNYTVEVDYYHATAGIGGEPLIDFSFSEPSVTARTSALQTTFPAAAYPAQYKTSLILNGYLRIQPGNAGFVSFDQRYSLDDPGDCIQVYYATKTNIDWIPVGQQYCDNHDYTAGLPGWTPVAPSTVTGGDWQHIVVPITSSGAVFPAQTDITIKFEFDSTQHDVTTPDPTDDGWLIDNVAFTTANTTNPGGGPTGTSATIITDASAVNQPCVPVTPSVTPNDPLDTYTFTILSNPQFGLASIQGNQLCYTWYTTGYPEATNGQDTFQYKVVDTNNVTVTGTATVTINPYNVPGIIPATDFDMGTLAPSAGVTASPNSYFDTDAGAGDGGTGYRLLKGAAYPDSGVDVWGASGRSFYPQYIGSNQTGQWWKYTVNVQTTDTYDVYLATAANPVTSAQFRMDIDGGSAINFSPSPSATNTKDWENWELIRASTGNLSQGKHVIRIFTTGSGSQPNIQWLQILPDNGTIRNLAAGIPPTITGGTSSGSAGKITDGTYNNSASNYWAGNIVNSATIKINLGSSRTLQYFVIWWNNDVGAGYNGNFAYQYQIQVSPTGAVGSWTTVVDQSGNTLTRDTIDVLSTPVTGQYVQIVITGAGGNKPAMFEAQVFGQ